MKLDDIIQQPGRLERIQQEATSAKICVSIPCKVLRYKPDKRTVDAQPLVREIGESEDLPILIDVPVWFPGSYTYNVYEGDECLVVFADRSIDGWYQTGDVSNPISARRHNLSDGIAFVGIRSSQDDRESINLEETFEDIYQKIEEGGGGGGGGAKVVTVTGTVTNASGAYTHTFPCEYITSDMKAIELELGTPDVFDDEISITANDGSITLTCNSVSGTSTFKASFIASYIMSSEYRVLTNRIAELEDRIAVLEGGVFSVVDGKLCVTYEKEV